MASLKADDVAKSFWFGVEFLRVYLGAADFSTDDFFGDLADGLRGMDVSA